MSIFNEFNFSKPVGSIISKSDYAYVFRWNDYYSPKALYKLLSHGLNIKVSTDKFTIENNNFSYGSILVPVSNQNKSINEINNIIEEISNETGVNLDPIHHKDRPKEVKLATCSSEKARKLLDYKTSTNMRQSVKKTAEYIRTRGTKKFQYHLPLEIINEHTPDTWKNKLI